MRPDVGVFDKFKRQGGRSDRDICRQAPVDVEGDERAPRLRLTGAADEQVLARTVGPVSLTVFVECHVSGRRQRYRVCERWTGQADHDE